MKQMLKLVISHRISSRKFGESGFGVPLAKLRSGSYFNKPVIDSSCKAPNRFLNIPGSQILKKCLTNRSTNLGLPTFRIFTYLFDFCLMCMCFLMCMDMRVQPMDSSTWLSLLADWRFAWSDRKFAVYILTSIPKYVIYCILYSAEHSRKGMYKLPWGFPCGTISWGLGLTCLWKRCHCSRLVVYPVICNLLHVPGAAVHQFVHELHGPRCVVGRDVFHSSTSLKNTMCVSTIGTTWTLQCIIFRLKTGGPKATLFVGIMWTKNTHDFDVSQHCLFRDVDSFLERG